MCKENILYSVLKTHRCSVFQVQVLKQINQILFCCCQWLYSEIPVMSQDVDFFFIVMPNTALWERMDKISVIRANNLESFCVLLSNCVSLLLYDSLAAFEFRDRGKSSVPHAILLKMKDFRNKNKKSKFFWVFIFEVKKKRCISHHKDFVL